MKIEVIPQGTATSPRGFLAGSTSSGLKKNAGELDLGLLFSRAPCVAAGLFTNNVIKAAPVLVSTERIEARLAQAVVVNAGCANAGTGREGLADARQMAAFAAKKLNIAEELVLVASTGVIGVRLDMEKVRAGVGKVLLSPFGGYGLARAIMTTDAWPKERAVAIEVEGRRIVIGGVAKGAGMIHPNLGTMLVFLTTDAAVEADFLDKSLRRAVATSFNMTTVDGDTSTNDSVFILANGKAGNKPLAAGMPGANLFQKALEEVCIYLARSIACNAEGASHLIEVTVEGAVSLAQARQAARTIAGSNLVKTAVHGADPNWGRILAALGRSGVKIAEDRVDIHIGEICLMHGGKPAPFSKVRARAALERMEVSIRVGLGLGRGKATAWGCDLSAEYVLINSAYTT
ncbi:MAG: bifunctional glutamate N-acetyltransferase/amino-acid acetyltransferase ArgJ [Chloroflexi bacterium]|nr:bifunctional glutamate N-acetyltransferase/amino-acid acetyltransferase ArgJ [Chloroflexota bacterium]